MPLDSVLAQAGCRRRGADGGRLLHRRLRRTRAPRWSPSTPAVR
ncbi:hypothetical protein ACRAWF_44090 [Streptomyces sp. L7]